MNRRRTLSLVLLPLALLFGALGCALPARQTPIPDEESIALTVQAVQDAEATRRAPTEVPPTEVPPTIEVSVTPTLPPTFTPTPTQTQVPQPCDAAQFVSDVTAPDETEILVNGDFTKTWRLRNVGTCTWTSGYVLLFDHGDRMSAPDTLTLTSGTVPPGATVDVSVNLKAPGSVGTYQGFYLLRSPSNVVFGIGAHADSPFWVKIKTVMLMAVIPIMPLQPLPLVQSSGTGAVIGDGNCFNLDDGTGESCGSADADFAYEATFLDQEIDPKSSAAFSSGKVSEPSYSDCSGASLSMSDRDITENRWYCYKTSGDNYGWIKVTDADMLTVRFDWKTW